MAQPVVHFEIIGNDPVMLREFYGTLFGWEFDVSDAASEAVSRPGQYGFVGNAGINGGVAGHDERRVLFYVGVPEVEAALQHAERLGGRRVMGPEGTPGMLVVGHFTDPEGQLIGVAGTA